MTNNEMITKYLNSIGFKLVQGESLMPLMSFLQMDVMFSIFNKEIRPLDFKHEMNQIRNRWIHEYGLFDRTFFQPFTIDERDEILDKMDSFEQYIWNDVTIMRIQIMRLIDEIDTDKSNVCASLILCNVFCQMAGIYWKNVFLNGKGKGKLNDQIVLCERWSSKLINLYHSKYSDRHINPNDDKQVVLACQAICNRIAQWLERDKEEDKKMQKSS